MYLFKEYLNSFQRNDSLVNNLMLVYRYHIVPIDASKHSTGVTGLLFFGIKLSGIAYSKRFQKNAPFKLN